MSDDGSFHDEFQARLKGYKKRWTEMVERGNLDWEEVRREYEELDKAAKTPEWIRERIRFCLDVAAGMRERGEWNAYGQAAEMVGWLRRELDYAKAQESGRQTQRERMADLLEEVGKLRAQHPGEYENANAAATYLIDHTPADRGENVWGYFIDRNDPRDRDRAIHNLAERIRTAERSLAGK